jgi:peptide/nickel transport system substrate-binding protein
MPFGTKQMGGNFMTMNVNRSRRVRQIAIGLGLALAVSTVGVSGSSAAKVPANTKAGGDITVVQWDQLLGRCYSPNPGNGAQAIMKTVFEGLFEQKADGQMVPFLAESATPSNDFKTWKIKIRSGIKFHDGTDLTAAVVALNLNTIQGATYFSNPVAYGYTAGSGLAFLGNMKLVGGAVASGDTVTIELMNSRRDFLNIAYASGRFYMRSQKSILDKTTCDQNPAGTGPFKWSGAFNTDTIKVVKNENYWRKDAAGNTLPYLNSITFKYVSSATARANAVRSGSADLAMFASGSDAKQMASLLGDRKVKSQLTGNNYYPVLGPNQAIAPFNNKNARMALAYATDQASYFKARNCTNGRCFGEARDSIVGKQNVMYNKAGYIKYDLAKAKAAVKAYETETGKKLEFTINVAVGDSGGMDNAKYSVAMWKKAGMTVSINNSYTSAELVSLVYPDSAAVAQGKLNPFQLTNINVYENRGTDFILPFLPSNAFTEPGNIKVAQSAGQILAVGAQLQPLRHKDAALDALIWTAAKETNAAKQKSAWKAVTKYIQENAYNIPIPGQQYGVFLNKKLMGTDRFILASGGQGIAMSNFGVNYTGAYLQK